MVWIHHNAVRCIHFLLVLVKLSVFQFKIMHNILSTNSLLYKMKKKTNSSNCPFCPDTEQIISLLFVHFQLAASFWNEFTVWYRALSRKHRVTDLSECEIIYGVLKGSPLLQNFNHVILIQQVFPVHLRKN